MDIISSSEFPRQKVSWGTKSTTAWKEGSVDATIKVCNTYGQTRRPDPRSMKRNYDLLNNKIDKKDFEYVLNPYNLSAEVLNNYKFPASLQPYDVVSPLFMLLFGEEAKRPFDPIVMAVNSDAANSKLDAKKGSLLQMVQQMLTPPQEEGQEPPPTPEAVLLEAQSNLRETKEEKAQHLLNYIIKRHNLVDVFQEGWKDALVAGEEIYSVDMVANAPTIRRVNPLEISYTLPNNSYYIDESEKIYERNKMSVSSIIDEFYEVLTPAQIDRLESWKEGGLGDYNFYNEGPTVETYTAPAGIPSVHSIYDLEDDQREYYIDVHRVRWKSKKKLGFLNFIDPDTDEPQEELIDEFYKIPAEFKDDPSMFIEWFWVNEYWEGTRIGKDMYINIRPRKHQMRPLDNLSSCRSGYTGTVYSATNSQGVSMMDRIYPWIMLYIIIWYRLELLLAANMDKIALIDTSLIPDDWEMDKWLFYAQTMKIGFVNSYNEGAKGERIGRVNQSTQNKHLDLSTGQSIQFYTNLVEVIENKIKDTTGITDQRLGAISASELVGNTQRAVLQSSHITEEYFRVHTNAKLKVCELAVELAKHSVASGETSFQYITDDMAQVMFTIGDTELLDRDFGIFIGNGPKEFEAQQNLKQLLQVAVQADKIDMSDVVDIINSNSLTTLKTRLKKSESDRRQQAQEMQKQQLEQVQQAQQQAAEQREKEMALTQYKIDEDNKTKLEVAAIGTYNRQMELDQNNNGIPDPLELADLAIKGHAVTSKENIEKLKIKQTEVQNKSQEKIATLADKTKRKEIESKERIAKSKPKTKN